MLALDARTRRPTAAERRRALREKQHFAKVRRAESWFAIQLRAIARHVAKLIEPFANQDPAALTELQRMLLRYAEILRPWAEATAARVIADVAARDAAAWFRHSRELGIALSNEVYMTPIGGVMRQLLDDQVRLITSLPVDAGLRVQEQLEVRRRMQAGALETAITGERYDTLRDIIEETSGVTLNRATLIARTETAKAHASITQARAQYIGAEQYIWRTMRDSAVRPAHHRLEGRVCSWSDPPEAEENGERHHPGQFPNCRCYSEPIIPEVIT
jgi:SPP1 gp7 family putative phage head morphogenesis protein